MAGAAGRRGNSPHQQINAASCRLGCFALNVSAGKEMKRTLLSTTAPRGRLLHLLFLLAAIFCLAGSAVAANDNTSTTVSSNLNPSVYGASVTFTVVVTDTDASRIP